MKKVNKTKTNKKKVSKPLNKPKITKAKTIKKPTSKAKSTKVEPKKNKLHLSKKTQAISLIVVSITIIISILGYSYAIFSQEDIQKDPNTITSGCFSLSFAEGAYDISLTNTYPMTETSGLQQKAYTVTVKNTCTIDSTYSLSINPLKNGTTLAMDKIRINVTDETDSQDNPILDTTLISSLNSGEIIESDTESLSSYIIKTGTLAAASSKNASDGASQTFNIRLWLDSAANNEISGQSFVAKIVLISQATDIDTND